ncbi:hypothetical protein Tco_0077863 [Tanacetum coccineum]
MEAIQAFLKEYDHIPPNKKCMALLLAEERFLKINHVMKEEQNQPEVMKELLLKLMDDLQILKGSQQEKKETAAQSCTPYWDVSMIDDERARENFLKDVCTFLRKFSRIPFGVTPKVILIAWERFGEIKDALTDKHNRKELESLLSTDNDYDEYNIIIASPIENLVPIPSEFKGISEICVDVPFNIEYIEALPLNLEYDSLEEVNEDQEEKEFDLEDIFQIQDVILREKLLKISRLVINIESLKDNPTPDRVLKSTFSSPIPIVDSDSFFKESDTSFSYSDNSLPEFETFSDHTEETRSGSTTTHANNSPPEYDSVSSKI